MPIPIDKDDKEPGLTDKEADNNKQLQKVHNRPPPEQNTQPPAGPAPKEPTPGQVVDLPTYGKLEDDIKKDEDIPIESSWADESGSSKRDDTTGSYGFGSGPPITKQERDGAGQEYKPADFKSITAPPVLSLAPSRIVELEDGDALGGDGGGGAPAPV